MSVLRSDHGAATDRHAGPGQSAQITLGMTWPMADALDHLSLEMNSPVEDVLSQAVALLMVAVDAQRKGQRLCMTDDDLNIQGEIVNFGISNEEIAPVPDEDSARLDP